MNRRTLVAESRALVLALALGPGLGLLMAPPAGAATRPVPIGKIEVAGRNVERSTTGRVWAEAEGGSLIRTGDSLRCGEGSVARLAIGWANLVLGPGSQLEIPLSTLLSIRVERGRLEERSEGADIVKIRTAECLVRGKGYVIVRRDAQGTMVSARLGRFRVDGGGRSIRLEPGTGTLVRPGQGPLAPVALQPAPQKIVPGPDPLYAERGQPVRLEWTSSAKTHQIELTTVGTDAVVFQLAVAGSPVEINVPWPGTYRWCVTPLDGLGIEGLPSRSGLICIPGF